MATLFKRYATQALPKIDLSKQQTPFNASTGRCAQAQDAKVEA